jgi:putative tryptophan/tyrosine transport system substrate-binding protein
MRKDCKTARKMETKRMQRHRSLRSWVGAIVLAVSALCVGVALAGTQARHYRVAVFTPGLSFRPVLEGLQAGLAQLGYVEGTNVTLVVEDTQGAVPDLAQRAARLVAAQPDVLVTVTTPHTKAARQATTRVPIVFTRVGDPLHYGLIASYASSQNNVTGISTYSNPLTGKRLELLQEIAPGIQRILAVVATNEANAQLAFQRLAETAQKLAIQVLRHDVTTREEIEHVLRATPPGSVEAMYHVPSLLVSSHMDLLIQKAEQEKLPLIVHEDSLVDQGALVSYRANSHLMGVQAAKLVAKILQGDQPAALPIQTPDKWFLAINLTTAKAIDLPLPLRVLERANHLVE